MDELVSVVMTVYNEPLEILQEAVMSILNQSYKNIEVIIVVDNPNNKEAINYLQKIQLEDSKVRLSINEKNIGLPLSLNKAIKLSNGKYIARMDADDISDNERIYKELLYLLKHKEIDLVGCNIEKINYEGKVVGKTSYPHYNFVLKRMLKYIDCVPHPTWLTTKKLYEELNGYRNIDACEDYDFLLRGILHNIKIAIVNERLLKYRINENGISLTKNNIQKATSKYLLKYYRQQKECPLSTLDILLESKEVQKYFKQLNDYRLLKRNLMNKNNVIQNTIKLLQNTEFWCSVRNKIIVLIIR